jgi:copper homeostasis protein
MPGSGINETNVLEIAKKTLAKNFHISVRKISESKMIFKNENLKMGGIQQISEFEKSITDETKVKLIKDILETISY